MDKSSWPSGRRIATGVTRASRLATTPAATTQASTTQAPNRPCLRWFLEFFTGYGGRLVLYSRNRMSDRTETLAVGSRAPEFLLSAANRDGILSLSGFLSRGTLIVEFLRGTW